MEKDKVKGWTVTDYAFEDLYDAYLSILFEYQGKEYRLSCEGDKALYDCDTGEILWTFTDKESFYNGAIFGRPSQDVINDSYLICLM